MGTGRRMTPEDVRRRTAEIRAIAARGDEEAAHGEEDRLHEDVLRAVAGGAEKAAELAAEALRTRKIAFARYTS